MDFLRDQCSAPFFSPYTLCLAKIIYHKLNCHFYADDVQLYLSFDAKLSTCLNQSVDKVQQCIKEIKLWMNNNMLKLNDDQTEVLFIASPHFKSHLRGMHASSLTKRLFHDHNQQGILESLLTMNCF